MKQRPLRFAVLPAGIPIAAGRGSATAPAAPDRPSRKPNAKHPGVIVEFDARPFDTSSGKPALPATPPAALPAKRIGVPATPPPSGPTTVDEPAGAGPTG